MKSPKDKAGKCFNCRGGRLVNSEGVEINSDSLSMLVHVEVLAVTAAALASGYAYSI